MVSNSRPRINGPAQVADGERQAVDRHLGGAHAVEVDEHQGVGEEDGVVEEGLGDHQRGTQDRPLRILVEHQAQEDQVAVLLLRDQADRLAVVDRRQLAARLADGVLDLRQLALRLIDAAVRHQPAWTLREGAADDDHDQRQHRPHQEGQPPAHVDGEGVEEDQGHERADDRAGPVGAVDPDVDASAVLRRHHLVDGRVDGGVLTADTHAGNEPGGVEEEQPAVVVARDERRGAGAEQVQQQGHDQQALAADPVRHPPEVQGTDHFADQVDRRDQPDLGRGHVERLRTREHPGHRAGDGDLQPVQDPGRAETGDHPGVERAPAQPVQTGRNRRAERSRSAGSHHEPPG